MDLQTLTELKNTHEAAVEQLLLVHKANEAFFGSVGYPPPHGVPMEKRIPRGQDRGGQTPNGDQPALYPYSQQVVGRALGETMIEEPTTTILDYTLKSRATKPRLMVHSD